MTTKTKEEKSEPKELSGTLVAEMAEVGVLHSHKKSKSDPRMKKFVVANRHEIDVLDANAVIKSIRSASDFLSEIVKKGGKILFVGTALPTRAVVESAAKNFKQPYVTHRWLGGTLTNFKIIKKRIAHYLDLKKKKAEGELEKYTKKEQVDFTKEIDKLSRNLEGLVDLEKLPEAVFVVDAKEHDIVIKEAKKAKIPVLAIVDSDDNPKRVDYPIIANDHSRSSVEWVINKIKDNL